MGKKFGSWFKSKRTLHEIPLIDFCLSNNLDVSYWSKVEIGACKPPQELKTNRTIIAYMINKNCFGIDDLTMYMDLIFEDNIADVELTHDNIMPAFYPINEDLDFNIEDQYQNSEKINKELKSNEKHK